MATHLQNPVGTAFHRRPRLAMERQPYQIHEVLQLSQKIMFADSFKEKDKMKKMMLLVVVLGVAGAGFGWQPSETTQANAATKVDVYAIDDPKAALAALRQKWRGAEDRVSQCDMSGFTEKFRELDKAQDWCYERSVSARTYSRTSRVRAYA